MKLPGWVLGVVGLLLMIGVAPAAAADEAPGIGSVSVDGVVAIGQTLTAVAHDVTGSPSPILTYQMYERTPDGQGGWNPWVATGVDTPDNQFVLTTTVGNQVRIRVYARNSVDPDADKYSATLGPIAPADAVPGIGSVSVSGSATGLADSQGWVKTGETITADAAGVTGSPTPDVTYLWKVSSDNGATWSDVSSNASFVPSAGGLSYWLVVTATNTSGSVNTAQAGFILHSIDNATPAGMSDHPTLSGTSAVGQALTPAAQNLVGIPVPVVDYQWQLSSDGTNWTDWGGPVAAPDPKVLTVNEVGKYVRVQVSVHGNQVGASNVGVVSTAYTNTVAPPPPLAKPTAVATSSSGLSLGGGLGHGSVTAGDAAAVVSCKIHPSAGGDWLSGTASPSVVDSGTVPVSCSFTGLMPGTQYGWLIEATSSAGTGQSAEQTFTTVELAPALQAGCPNKVCSGTLISLAGADLSGQDLSGYMLIGFNFTGTDFAGANLSGASLQYADFTGADLRGANLDGAHLDGAKTSGWLRIAALSRSTAPRGDVRPAHYQTPRRYSLSLEGASLRGATLRGVHFRGVDLSRTNLKGAKVMKADLRNANLASANLTRANLKKALLVRANLVSGKATKANFSHADLHGAFLQKLKKNGARFTGANLKGAHL